MSAVTRTRTLMAKTQFHQVKNELEALIEDRASRKSVREKLSELSDVLINFMQEADNLASYYGIYGEVDKAARLQKDIDNYEAEYSRTEHLAQRYIKEAATVRLANEQTQKEKLKEEINRLTLELETTFHAVKKELSSITSQSQDETAAAAADQTNPDVSVRDESDADNRTQAQSDYDVTYRQRPQFSTPVEKKRELSQSAMMTQPELSSIKPQQLRPSAREFLPQQSAYRQNSQSLNEHEGISTMESLSKDSSRLLTRVHIPKFNGDKRSYEGWKAAFLSCVDRTNSTPEYKLLRLHESLEGDPLTIIQHLGFSPAAYQVAMNRLEHKYGGKKRQIILRMEELQNFKPVRDGNSNDLEKLAELLDCIVVNLTDADQISELGGGTLYMTVQKKLSENLLARYYRWLYEKQAGETVLSLQRFVDEESEFMLTASEAVKGLTGSTAKSTTPQKKGKQSTFVTTENTKRKSSFKCCLCQESHGLWACEKFRKMTVPSRWDVVVEHKRCFRCLNGDHFGKDCPKSRTCGINGCKSFHNRLLHSDKETQAKPREKPEKQNDRPEQQKEEPKTQTQDNSAAQSGATNSAATYTTRGPIEMIAMRTVLVIVTNGNMEMKIYALLDEASSRTYINRGVAGRLGLQGDPEELHVSVIDGHQETLKTSRVQFKLKSTDGSVNKTVNAFTAGNVAGKLPVVNWANYKKHWDHLEHINFPTVGRSAVVDMLIGIDHADLMISENDVGGEVGEPIARKTPLGWTCISCPPTENNITNFTFAVWNTDAVDQLLRRYWEIDTSPTAQHVKLEDKLAIEKASESMTFDSGQYGIGIPWNSNKWNLRDNYNMACKRLQGTEKRLMKNPELSSAYKNLISNHLEKDYIRKVTADEMPPRLVWYLPHFPVVRPDKTTTKVRIVFDASAPHEGLSLNDAIYQGPKLQNDLFQVLIRFRRHPVAISCDISEMYLQIKLQEQDRCLHRFLWRDMDPGKSPETYEFSRIVFGVNCSPFLAQYVTQQHAKNHQKDFPRAADTIIHSTYMDDSLDSAPDVQTAIDLRQQLDNLWKAAGMKPHKWLSNCPGVLAGIPPEDCAKEVNLDHGDLPTAKTLGIMWSAQTDEFRFQTKPVCEDFAGTKRDFLRKIATLFDPLGLVQPFVIRAKIILQEMWLNGMGWDEPLDTELLNKATAWFADLPHLERLKIPRCMRADKPAAECVQLHTFVDAAQDAYGAAVYVRQEYDDGTVTCTLLASKSRVTPLQAISIPRLELMAAITGTRLTKSIGETLNLDSSHWTFWSDSADVLYWIHGQSKKFKPFVANQVGEIQAETSPNQWHHISTNENPADMLTRGLDVAAIAEDRKWWSGPNFLLEGAESWPKNEFKSRIEWSAHKNEMKKQFHKDSTSTDVTLLTKEQDLNNLDPERHSRWERLTRIYAYVVRFMENCRLPKQLRKKGPIDSDEIMDAETFFIKCAQQSAYTDEIKAIRDGKELPNKSKLLPLRPMIDDEGVLRCDSRLKYSQCLPWETKYPVILPRNSRVTKLLIKKYHEQSEHHGTNHVLAQMSAKFWIIAGREAIREWESECMECRRRKAKPAAPLMAPLPALRTKKSLRAFSQTSVDMGGPYITKQGRGKTRQKRYLCLFTCLATRAVHLEVAFSLSTDSFLNAFTRMTARRGVPTEMLSDNGTNFLGAKNELDELAALDKERIQRETAHQHIKWHFNPPAAPHFSGVHESMIKAAKRAINAILGSADINDEELMTAVAGAEGLLNSRPLTYQSANPDDIVPLTPNHFIHGQMGGQFAPEIIDHEAYHPKKRWRRVQELIHHVWKRWIQEWLPSLSPRKKWLRDRPDYHVGDVVIVTSPDVPRGKWPIGRIMATHPGGDGTVRVVDVKVQGTTLRRPVVKLCPLVSGEDEL